MQAMKPSRLPSGDQTGSRASAAARETLRFEPSTTVRTPSVLPAVYAKRRPSEDHASACAPNLVRVLVVPVAIWKSEIDQLVRSGSASPLVSDVSATAEPSGDHAGR